MTRYRVLIADDHRIFAEGLRILLEPEFEVVGLAEDGNEMVEESTTMEERHRQLIEGNPGAFSREFVERVPTSIDLLKPDSPLLNRIDEFLLPSRYTGTRLLDVDIG